jgi:hypothetical protein
VKNCVPNSQVYTNYKGFNEAVFFYNKNRAKKRRALHQAKMQAQIKTGHPRHLISRFFTRDPTPVFAKKAVEILVPPPQVAIFLRDFRLSESFERKNWQ